MATPHLVRSISAVECASGLMLNQHPRSIAFWCHLRDFVKESCAASSFQREGFFLRFIVRRLAVSVFLFTLELDAAARRAGLLDTVRPVARRLTPPSARLFNFLSAAFSCLRLALSKVTTLPWPNSRAQAISVP